MVAGAGVVTIINHAVTGHRTDSVNMEEGAALHMTPKHVADVEDVEEDDDQTTTEILVIITLTIRKSQKSKKSGRQGRLQYGGNDEF